MFHVKVMKTSCEYITIYAPNGSSSKASTYPEKILYYPEKLKELGGIRKTLCTSKRCPMCECLEYVWA